MSDPKVQPISDGRRRVEPQITSSKDASWENAPSIPQVVEAITHRFLGGADIPYLCKKYDGMGRERIEEIIRFGVNRQIKALREAVREERRAA